MNHEQHAEASGNGSVAINIIGSWNTVTVHPGGHALTLVSPTDRKPEIREPIDLLNPYCRAFGVVGREGDMKQLLDWAEDSPDPVSLQIVYGPGGSGKTRMAIELIEKVTEKYWQAGFVSGAELDRIVRYSHPTTWEWKKPTLVVLDYVAAHVTTIKQWLSELVQQRFTEQTPPLRILLLERHADPNDAWVQTLRTVGQSDAKLTDLLSRTQPIRLSPIHGREDRRTMVSRMLEKIASLSGTAPKRVPAAGEHPAFDKQLEKDVWNEPLNLMMAVLVAEQARVQLVTVLDMPRTDIALKLVPHEQGRIRKLFPGREELQDKAIHLAALACLTEGLSRSVAIRVAKREANALGWGSGQDWRELVNQLNRVLPPNGDSDSRPGIGSLVPDILAEAFIVERLVTALDADEQKALIRRLAETSENPAGLATTLVRTVHDFQPMASQPARNIRPWLDELIAWAKEGKRMVLLAIIENVMPVSSVVLQESAVSVSEALVAHLESRRDSLDTDGIAEFAGKLNNLANRLSEVGRRSEALAPAEEAVNIYRELADQNPAAYRPALATSLNNLANRLSEVGRRSEALAPAEEAVAIRRELADQNPAAYRPALASSLNNLAAFLSEVGRRSEALAPAEEAVNIYRELADQNPAAYLPDLAMSCGAMGAVYRSLERHMEAADSFAEGIRAIAPALQALPEAFAPLAANLARDYLAAMAASGAEPDQALLQPIAAVLEELNKKHAENKGG